MFRTLIPIILIITAALVGFFQVRPLYAEMSEVRNNVLGVEDALQKMEEISSTVKKLENKIESIPPEDIDKLENVIIPSKIDRIRFLNMLSSLASKRNLFLNGLQIESDNTSNSNDTLTGGKAASAELKKLGLSFSVSTDYETFKMFLIDLEKSMALIDVDSITISTPTSGEDESGLIKYTYDIKMSTYWME
jgi:hypothetical protein